MLLFGKRVAHKEIPEELPCFLHPDPQHAADSGPQFWGGLLVSGEQRTILLRDRALSAPGGGFSYD